MSSATSRQAAGAPADTIDTSVEWAIEFLKGRSSASKPHEMRRNLRQQRSEMQDTLKKLSKILQKEVLKQFEDSLEKTLKAYEQKADKFSADKAKQIKG